MNQKQLLNIVLFIICPFLSLPILFCEIYNGKKYPLVLLAIFMGCLSMFYFPYGDQYRYFMNLEMARYLSLEEKFDFDSLMIYKELNIVNIVVFVFAKLGLNLELLRFTLTFLGCLLLFKIYVEIKEQLLDSSINRFQLIYVFIIIFLSIPYYLINYGFRTGFGACLFTYGIYLFYLKNKYIKGFLFFLLAASTHFLFVIHTLIYSIIYFIDFNLSRKKTLIVSIILLLMSMSIFSLLLGKIEFIDAILNSYVYGDNYGAGSYDYFSPKSKALWLNGIINSVVMFFVFFKLNNKGKFENVIYILFVLCVFAIPYATFFQRLIRSSIPILALYLIVNFSNIIIRKAKFIIIISLTIAFISPFWVSRNQYRYARLERILYSSLPTLLENHYDEKTISKKVDIDGIWND